MRPPNYDSKDYWIERFDREEKYDWLFEYSQIASIVRNAIPKDATVLQLGCGNSNIPFDMYDDGYKYILNIDYCANVIEKMREKTMRRYPSDPHVSSALEWRCADALNMESTNPESFDAIIDKSTSDCIACTSEDGAALKRLSAQMHRLCVPGGNWVIITYSSSRGSDISSYKECGKRMWDIKKIPLQVRPPEQVKSDITVTNTPAIYYYCLVCTKL